MTLTQVEENKLKAMMEEAEAIEKFDVANRAMNADFSTQAAALRQTVEAAHPEVAIKRVEWEAKVQARKDIFK